MKSITQIAAYFLSLGAIVAVAMVGDYALKTTGSLDDAVGELAEASVRLDSAITDNIIARRQLAIANETIDGLIPHPVVNPDPMSTTMKLLIAGGGHGSATHIGNGYAITAGHVAEKEGDILTARFQNGKKVKAVTLWSNKKYDVALIKLEGYTGPASNLECRTPDFQESIGLYGNPLAMEFVKTNGIVASAITHSYSKAWADALPIDGAMAGGMSGGGAFDRDGDLVGINVGVPVQSMGYSGTFTGISFIVPASTICGLLAR